jgi:hypothetical protein
MSSILFRQFFYTPHIKPVLLDCNFIVDPANGNGFGVSSLKGQGIKNVYMHTTAAFTGTVTNLSKNITGIGSGTANLVVGAGVNGTNIPSGTVITSIISSSSVSMSNAATGTATESINYTATGSPNPAAGVIVVTFTDNYNRYYGGFSGFGSPIGTPVTATTTQVAYVITSLGTATLAQWQAVGLPIGITPAVGAAFIATASATVGGSATVAPTATAGSGIDHIEVLGDPNVTFLSNPVGSSQIVLQCFASDVVTAPATGSAVRLSFYLSDSSVLIRGE